MRPLFTMPIKQLLKGEPPVGRLPPVADCGTLFVNSATDEIEYYPRNASLLEVETVFGYYVQSYSRPFSRAGGPVAITTVASIGAPRAPSDRQILAVAAYAARNPENSWRGLYNGDVRHTAQVLGAGRIDHLGACADTLVVFNEAGVPTLLMFSATGGQVMTLSGRPYEMIRGSTRLPFGAMSGWQITSVHSPLLVDGRLTMSLCMKQTDAEKRAKVLVTVQVDNSRAAFFPIDSEPRPLGINGVPLGPIDAKGERFLFMSEYGEPVLVPTAEVAKSMERSLRDRAAA